MEQKNLVERANNFLKDCGNSYGKPAAALIQDLRDENTELKRKSELFDEMLAGLKEADNCWNDHDSFYSLKADIAELIKKAEGAK